MFLRCKVRRKDGKQHRYWSVVENTRTARGRVVQRHVLYLGEINDTQELAWRRSIEVLEEGATQPRTLSLFPEDRFAGALADASIVHVKLSEHLDRAPPRQLLRVVDLTQVQYMPLHHAPPWWSACSRQRSSSDVACHPSGEPCSAGT